MLSEEDAVRSSGMTGSKWFTCGQCGFDYPVKYRRRQRGMEVCTYLPCFDEPGRDELANMLADPDETDVSEVELEEINDGF